MTTGPSCSIPRCARPSPAARASAPPFIPSSTWTAVRTSVIVLVLDVLGERGARRAGGHRCARPSRRALLAVRDWQAMLARLKAGARRTGGSSAQGTDISRRPRLSGLAGRQSFHLPGRARLSCWARMARHGVLEPREGQRAGRAVRCAGRGCHAQRRGEPRGLVRGSARLSGRSRTPDRHQIQQHAAWCIAASIWIISASRSSTPTAPLPASTALSACSPPAPIASVRAPFRCCAARSRR